MGVVLTLPSKPSFLGWGMMKIRCHHWLIVCAIDILGPFSTDSYIPNMLSMQHELSTTAVLAGLTLQANWLAKGLGTLVVGAMSDTPRWGRRGALLLTFVFYIVGTAGCAATPTASYGIYSLIVFRILQGFGETGTTMCNAITRDVLEDPKERLRVLTTITSLRIAAVAVSPSIGGVLGVAFGWRAVFAGLAVCGSFLAVATALCLPETLHDAAVEKGVVVARLSEFRSDPAVSLALAALLSYTLTFSLLLIYLSNVTTLFEGYFGFSTLGTALFMGSAASIFVLTNIVLSVLMKMKARSVEPFPLLRFSMLCSLAGASVSVAAIFHGARLTPGAALFFFVAVIYVNCLSIATGFGAAATIFLQPFGDAAGKASGVLLVVRTVVATGAAQASVDVWAHFHMAGLFAFFSLLGFAVQFGWLLVPPKSKRPVSTDAGRLQAPLLDDAPEEGGLVA